MQVAFFVNSGSEANDLAMKMARLYSGNYDFLALRNGYHGKRGLNAHSTWRYNMPQVSCSLRRHMTQSTSAAGSLHHLCTRSCGTYDCLEVRAGLRRALSDEPRPVPGAFRQRWRRIRSSGDTNDHCHNMLVFEP